MLDKKRMSEIQMSEWVGRQWMARQVCHDSLIDAKAVQ